jgi:hypothetical protein
MLHNLKNLFNHPSSEAERLVEEFASQDVRLYPFDLKSFTAGTKFLGSGAELQRAVVMAMVAWFRQRAMASLAKDGRALGTVHKMGQVLLHMLESDIPFTRQEISALVDWYTGQWSRYLYGGSGAIIKTLDRHARDNAISPAMKHDIDKLIARIQATGNSPQALRWVLHLKELAGGSQLSLPLKAGDVWAEAALAELHRLETGSQRAWTELMLHGIRPAGSAPSKAWMQKAQKQLEALGEAEVFSRLLRWFPLVDKVKIDEADRTHHGMRLLTANVEILRGMVWMCSLSGDPEMARALAGLAMSAYKKIPGTGPRAAKLGNACFWALANMPGSEGIAQLSILKTKIKAATAQKLIKASLNQAAQRSGITTEEIEELSIPTYGMQEIGVRRDELGEFISELRIDGSEVEQHWIRKDGRHIASAPKAVKEGYPAQLKEISQAGKEIRRMLAAQRERIDNLYLNQRSWHLADWRARYLDHPLTGTIARRLIWKFSKGDQAASGIWWSGKIVDRNGGELPWLDDGTAVELWHPIHAEPDLVLEWRAWLAGHEVRQPFKQAHREVYLLTDAERQTRTYSNRYSAHILRQHQFNSLCAARGWKNSLRLMVDDIYPPATKVLPPWGLRAEYWVEGAGDVYGTDTNDTGTYLYLTTDQVRFYPLDALQNMAHAGGGGYMATRWNGQDAAEPLPLEEIPPLVFSEIMRDVDMFVGVASIGNDPNWIDGGGGMRYRDYWHAYSFGELTESAATRKQVLETIVPRLKIAPRCTIGDKFMVVRGDLRTYKIHLGSGNILMEPNDQYLCIVPGRHTEKGAERLFVPFEGDQTLAIILSKAFLLAEDKKITDPTITRQIKSKQ